MMAVLDPFHDPLSIGNLAISHGYATPEQVAEAVKEQQRRLPLGELLIAQNVITPTQLDELLYIQKIERAKTQGEVTRIELARQDQKAQEATTSLQNYVASIGRFVAKA